MEHFLLYNFIFMFLKNLSSGWKIYYPTNSSQIFPFLHIHANV